MHQDTNIFLKQQAIKLTHSLAYPRLEPKSSHHKQVFLTI